MPIHTVIKTKIANKYINIDEKISLLLEKFNSLFDIPITKSSCQDFCDQGYCEILFDFKLFEKFIHIIADKSNEKCTFDLLYYLIGNKNGSKIYYIFNHGINSHIINKKITKKHHNLRNRKIDINNIFFIDSSVKWNFNPIIIPSIIQSFDELFYLDRRII